MQRTIQILLLTRDPGLEAELAAFAAEMSDEARLVVHVEEDDRRAVSRAMERRVDLLIVELDQDVAPLARMAAELRQADHPPIIAAAYRPLSLDGDDAMSTRFVELLRSGVRDFLSRPLSIVDLRSLVERELPEHTPSRQAVGRVVSFVGSKGGVGKSTLAVNTAVGLAREGSVLIIDASLQHGVAADLLGLSAPSSIADAAREVDRLDARLISNLTAQHASGVSVLAAPANAIDAAAVDEGIMSRVIAVARRAYDFVVVDTFPLLDSVTLAILDMSDLSFVVLNDSAPTVNGTAELLTVLDRVGLDRTRCRVVLNKTHSGRGVGVSPSDVATRLDRPLDHIVPFSGAVLAAANTGKPPTAGMGRLGRWGRALADIARAASSGAVVSRAVITEESDSEGLLEPAVLAETENEA
ncbi:MAG: AAA family ATPase [Planctomycetota bacterium]|nr:AAA family ATPase [Planctomycetota bacterium]